MHEIGPGPDGPIRMCVVCRERLPKKELERYACPKSGRGGAFEQESDTDDLIPDPNQALPGRGFYICGKADCRQRFKKARIGLMKKCKGENK